MKKFLLITLAAAAALSITACKTDGPDPILPADEPVLTEYIFKTVSAKYYGDEFDTGTGSYEISLSTTIDDPNFAEMSLRFFSTLANIPTAASPRGGVYKVGSTENGEMGTYIPGGDTTGADDGTVLFGLKNGNEATHLFNEQTFSVTKNGTSYKISFEFLEAEKNGLRDTIRGSFDGVIEFVYDESRLMGRIEETLENSRLGMVYGERYDKGTTNFGVTLYQGQWSALMEEYMRPFSYIEVSGFTSMQTDMDAFGLEPGTYTFDANARDNGTARTFYPKAEGYTDGMKYYAEAVDGTVTEIDITGGTFTVSESGGQYTIDMTLTGEDINTGRIYNNIELSFTGTIDFDVDDYSPIAVTFEDGLGKYFHTEHSLIAGSYDLYFWFGDNDPNYTAPSQIIGDGMIMYVGMYSNVSGDLLNARMVAGDYVPISLDTAPSRFTYNEGIEIIHEVDGAVITGAMISIFKDSERVARYPITSGDIKVELADDVYTISGSDMMLRSEQPYSFSVTKALTFPYVYPIPE